MENVGWKSLGWGTLMDCIHITVLNTDMGSIMSISCMSWLNLEIQDRVSSRVFGGRVKPYLFVVSPVSVFVKNDRGALF